MPKKQDVLLKIHVPGFFKNNLKTENKRFYFRVNPAMYSDSKLINVHPLGRYLYLTLLMLCCEQGRDHIEIMLSSLSVHANMKPSSCRHYANIISCARLISITYDPPISISISIRNSISSSIAGETTAAAVVSSETPPTNFESFKKQIPPHSFEAWITLYKDKEFVERELLRCWTHYQGDGSARDVGRWVSLINTWLERGFRYNLKHSKKKKSAGGPTMDELLKSMEGYDPNNYK